MNTYPKISVIITTYNRAYIVKRAIDSVLNQSFQDFEIIIVDDCSMDDTYKVIIEYKDHRIRYFKHDVNKGVCSAKNTGLNNINGEWFTFLDSDDELLPDAIEILLEVPVNVNNEITAVTCNCIDSVSNQFSGKGLDKNCYLDNSMIMSCCSGEFWGITKTHLLQLDRFNENIPGFEVLLWYKINDRAKRYYIHQGLRIYHTEQPDSIIRTNSPKLETKLKVYRELIHEESYLITLKKHAFERFRIHCLKGFLILFAVKDPACNEYKKYLLDNQPGMKYRMFVSVLELMGPFMVRFILGVYKKKLI